MTKNYLKTSGHKRHDKTKFSLFINCLVVTGLLMSLSIAVKAQDDALPGRVQKKGEITSKILNEQRSLWIYTPAGYQTAQERYPVLYLLDPDQNFA